MDFIGWGTQLLYNYGLIGVFLISVLSASSIMVYLPGWTLIVLAGHIYNPLLVGFIAALGYTVGETTAFLFGRGGNYLIEKKHLAKLDKIKEWFQKHGFVMLPVFAVIPPLPLDLLSFVAGTLKYDIRKFWAGVFLGELVKCLAYAYAGYYGINLLFF